MCLFAVYYKSVPEAPLLVAANREESFARRALAPRVAEVQLGKLRARGLFGIDLEAGGTWLGINGHGLVVAVTNRPRFQAPEPQDAVRRSRGLLCRELLAFATASQATAFALDELSTGCYAGANYICLDTLSATVVHAGDRLETVPLEAGLNLIANGDLNDELDARLQLARRLFASQPIDSVGGFFESAKRVCSHSGSPAVIVRGADRGTVSSTLIAVTKLPEESVYLYADGPPDECAYADYSPELRALLE